MDFLIDTYTRVADRLSDKVAWLWFFLFLSFFLTFASYVTKMLIIGEGAEPRLIIPEVPLVFVGFTIFWLIPFVQTFRRLKNEKGIYKNYRIQAVVFSVVFTLIFLFIAYAFILVLYAEIFLV